jgi:sterol desaturase/sphingolipid hydroxylase (fatty acid hydroxylase superfamily)
MLTLLEHSLYFLMYFAFFAVVFAIFEIPFRQAHPQPILNRHSLIDFAYGYVNQIFNIVLLSAFVATVINQGLNPRFPEHPLAAWIDPLPVVLQLLLALFLLDFFQYWRHRFSHRFLWRFHASHHSALELRWSTHFRFHPVELVVNILGFAVFLYFLGFGLTEMVWVHLIATANNMYLHSILT